MVTQERKRNLGILAVVAGMMVAVACGGGSGGGYGTGPSVTPTPVPNPGGAADVTITINSMSGAQSFSPNPSAAKVGQKVAWRNGDSITHTATGSGWDTGAIPPGTTSTPITFSAAGTFDYHCSIHPSMVGSLTVSQ